MNKRQSTNEEKAMAYVNAQAGWTAASCETKNGVIVVTAVLSEDTRFARAGAWNWEVWTVKPGDCGYEAGVAVGFAGLYGEW